MTKVFLPFSPWSSERPYFDGDRYFQDLLASIRRSRKSVDLESYIFAVDRLGDRMVRELGRAAARGVRVRVLVDYVGSPDFEEGYGPRLRRAGVPFQVYRPWGYLWERMARSRWAGILGPLRGAWRSWIKVNHRDHRKLCLIDGREAWVGSFNVSEKHLRSVSGKNAWRDTGLRLGGLRTPVFKCAFLSAWYDRIRPGRRRAYRRMLTRLLLEDPSPPPVLFNSGKALGRAFRKEWRSWFRGARRRIWLTSPYFVPTGRMFRALLQAARRGLDVRLLLPGASDVPVVRLASLALYGKLLAAGARLYEYQPGILHAKTLLADDRALVGSSNLDHRSALHDLEINVAPLKAASIRALERGFLADLRVARRVTERDRAGWPLCDRMLSWTFFQFRRWL